MNVETMNFSFSSYTERNESMRDNWGKETFIVGYFM